LRDDFFFGCDSFRDSFLNRRYSPVHNVDKTKTYPAVLLTTGDHDDRVSPLHTFKHIATLQNELTGNPHQTAPLLVRIEEKVGFGFGI
jgi:prolyl oligopeptidase